MISIIQARSTGRALTRPRFFLLRMLNEDLWPSTNEEADCHSHNIRSVRKFFAVPARYARQLPNSDSDVASKGPRLARDYQKGRVYPSTWLLTDHASHKKVAHTEGRAQSTITITLAQLLSTEASAFGNYRRRADCPRTALRGGLPCNDRTCRNSP